MVYKPKFLSSLAVQQVFSHRGQGGAVAAKALQLLLERHSAYL